MKISKKKIVSFEIRFLSAMVMSIWIGNSRFHCINNTVIGLRFAGHITRMKHVTPATIK